jgi:GNAT superfamily N-acetyltransferase
MLAWRIEATCLNAWPALRQVWLGGWLLRFSEGLSRRANSANPLHARPQHGDRLIAASEALFAAQGLDPVFRIPSMMSRAIETRLDRRGYGEEGATSTRFAALDEVLCERRDGVELAGSAAAEWLAAMTRLQGRSAAQHEVYARTIAAIALPVCFAAVRVQGDIAALAYGVIHDDLLCIESVVTAAPLRGRGLALHAIGALAAWAKGRDARGVCLQVTADNAPALALYRRFGLHREIYTYRYRRAPKRG